MPVDAMSFQQFQSRAPAQVSGRPKRRNNQVARTPDYGYPGPPIATTGPIAGESSHQREVRIQRNIAERRRRMAMPQVGGAGAGTQTQDPFPARPGPQNVVPISEQYSPPPQTGGRPAFDPNASVYGRPQIGGGFVYAPDLRNTQLSPQDQRQVDMDTRWQQVDPAGAYSNIQGYNRFRSLQGQQRRPLRIPPDNFQLPSGQTVLRTYPDGQQVGRPSGYIPTPEETIAGNRRGQGRTTAYVRTGGPVGYELTADQEAARQAGIERAAGRRDSLRQGRRDRAIARHGLTHLQPSYANAPLDAQRYSNVTGRGTPDEQRTARVRSLVANNTAGEGEERSTDWGATTRELFAGDFRENPRDAWPALRDAGMTIGDIDELLDEADGYFGFFGDPLLEAQLIGLREAATQTDSPRRRRIRRPPNGQMPAVPTQQPGQTGRPQPQGIGDVFGNTLDTILSAFGL